MNFFSVAQILIHASRLTTKTEPLWIHLDFFLIDFITFLVGFGFGLATPKLGHYRNFHDAFLNFR
jgi:hypothetical protein